MTEPLWWKLLMQFALAGVGTLCFAVLFCVPKKHWLACAADGAVGWGVYALMLAAQPSTVVATLAAAVPLALLARVFALTRRAPATVFLLCGIFPLVPGAGIYYTAYYFMRGENEACAARGVETFKIALALALGIAVALGLPLPGGRKKKSPEKEQ